MFVDRVNGYEELLCGLICYIDEYDKKVDPTIDNTKIEGLLRLEDYRNLT